MKQAKQHLLPLVMMLVMMAMSPTMMWADGTKPSGSGTSSDPYQITSANELIWFRDAVNGTNTGTNTGTGICARVTADFQVGNQDWAGIGTSSKKYTGTFDGNNKTISIKHLSATGDNFGLFGYIDGATIKDLTIAPPNTGTSYAFTSSYGNVGTVVGRADGASKILNVKSSINLTISGAKSHIGGIVGYIQNTTQVSGCTYSGTINAGSSKDCIGGIVGFSYKDFATTITNCFFSGSITTTASDGSTWPDNYVLMGGILGYVNDETTKGTFGGVKNCFSCGTLTAESATKRQGIGAIIGATRGKAIHDNNVTGNYYINGATALGNNNADNTTNKKITISVKANNANYGTVTQTYVNPTANTNTLLQVEATTNTGYHFNGWSDSGKQTHTVGLTSDVSLTATFAPNQYTITIKRNYDYRCTVSCTLNGSPFTLSEVQDASDASHTNYQGTFDYGAEPVFTVTPAQYCEWNKWTDDNTNQSRTYKVTGDATLTANCNKTSYTLTLQANNAAFGTVSGTADANTDSWKGNNTTGKADAFNKATFTATPAEHYHFVKWTDDRGNEYTTTNAGTGNTCTTDANGVNTLVIGKGNITQNTTYTAQFAPNPYTITVTSADENMGTVTGGGTYDYNKSVGITATPNEGYHFVNWTKDGTVVSTSASCNYSVHGNETLVANFHQLTAYAAVEATCTTAGNTAYWTCATCDKHYSDNKGTKEISANSWVVPAKGHDFTSQITTETYFKSDATCTKAATYYYKCSRCDEKGTESYTSTEEKDKAKDHDFTSQTATEAYKRSAATCTEAVTYYYLCSSCGTKGSTYYASTEEKDKAKGHDWSGDDTHTYCTSCNHSWIYYTASEKVTPYTDALSGYTKAIHTFDSTTKEGVIEFTSTLTSIGGGAFKNCTSLHSVTIPSSVTSIDGDAFKYCTSLQSVTIPSSVTSIGYNTFRDCSKLQSITIPSSVTSIGSYALGGCKNLSSITVDSNNKVYDSRDNCNAIIKKADNSLIAGCKSTTIPGSVTSIGEVAFYDCTDLQSITIPNSVTSIGDGAFYGCTGLKSITIPSSVTSIGDGAFYGCTGLKSITIPSSVTSIDDNAFRYCRYLANVAFNSIPQVGRRVFDGCDNLNTKTLALTDESYVAANKGNFPDLTEAPTFTRTLTTEWGTIVVPFPVTITDNENYELCSISAVSGPNLLVNKATGTLAAGTPVLFHKKVAGDYALTLSGVADEEGKYPVSTAINNPAAISGLTLKGTYAKAEVATGAGYVFNGSKFVKTTKATQVAPFHAYLAGAIADVDAITPEIHVHSIAKVDAKAATCTAAGNKAYWKCSVCGKLFSDETCTTETTLAAMTINAGHQFDANNKCTVCQLVVDPAQAVRLSIAASSGTSGFSGESYDKLFDGNTSTKWCLNNTNPFVEFYTSELVYVTGYSFTTGNDTEENPSRNPKTWKLYAKTSPSGAWEVIDSKSNDETLKDENEREYRFPLSKPTALRYQYFRLEFTHSGLMQLSEISLYGHNERSQCAHSKLTHHDEVPATCTTAGTREYWSCPDCDAMFSSATANAETMISDTSTPKLSHTIGADGKCSGCGKAGTPYLMPTYNTPGNASSGIASWTTAYLAESTTITSESTTLSAGWYLVSNEVTITSRITCNGAVHLILAPGSKLNANNGITVSGKDNSLTIYGQPDGAGELIATGGVYAAGIGGGGENGSGSNITINGGTVTATGGGWAAGIGGGLEASGSNITINGGTVTAKGGDYAAGIGGGGYGGCCSNVTINGGTVTAKGGDYAAGIGIGTQGSLSNDIKVSTNLVIYNRGNDDAVITNSGKDLASALSDVQSLWIVPSHTHNYINKVSEAYMVTPATCTKLATYYRSCEVCGKSEENPKQVFESGELKPHDFTKRVEDNDRIATAGSCTSHATYYYGCAVCGLIENNAEHTFKGTTYTHTFVNGKCSQCQKRGVVYRVPTYKTAHVKASGIASWTTAYVAEYTTITNESTTLSAGWYLVSSEVTINDRITCNGDVHLILAPGSKLNANAGITVSGIANSLTIYGQPGGAGKLIATGGDNASGIGGGEYGSGSNITINGGTVTATGGYMAAGIGGGDRGSGSDITINGGTVTATGGYDAAGIGGGNRGSGSDITINGGTVTATGGTYAAGIGGGNNGLGSNIRVSTNLDVYNTDKGSVVIANSGDDLASALSGVKNVLIPLSGDLNADGNVTIADLTLLVELLKAGGTITNPAADVDRDGDVDIDDVNALRNILLGE